MGFYWFNAFYLGRLLSKEAYDRLMSSPAAPPAAWITDLGDPRGRYVLHPPGAYVSLGSMDPILEEHEIRAGHVKRDEIIRAAGRDRVAPVLDVPDTVKEQLREYVRAAAPPEAPPEAPGFGLYIVQGEWSSLSLPETSSSKVTHNIRVVG